MFFFKKKRKSDDIHTKLISIMGSEIRELQKELYFVTTEVTRLRNCVGDLKKDFDAAGICVASGAHFGRADKTEAPNQWLEDFVSEEAGILIAHKEAQSKEKTTKKPVR